MPTSGSIGRNIPRPAARPRASTAAEAAPGRRADQATMPSAAPLPGPVPGRAQVASNASLRPPSGHKRPLPASPGAAGASALRTRPRLGVPPLELFYTTLANHSAALEPSDREPFRRAVLALSCSENRESPQDGLELLQAIAPQPASTWLTTLTITRKVVRRTADHDDRLRVCKIAAALVQQHGSATANLACDSLCNVRGAKLRADLLLQYAHNFEHDQLVLFLYAAEALLESPEGACHTAVHEAAKLCRKTRRGEPAQADEPVEEVDAVAEDNAIAQRLQGEEYARCNEPGFNGAQLRAEPGAATRCHPGRENVQEKRRLRAQQEGWRIVAGKVPASLRIGAVMLLIGALEEEIVDMAKADQHPFSAAKRRDEETEELSDIPEWEFLRSGYRGKKDDEDLMQCYSTNCTDIQAILGNPGPISVRAFTARVWLAMHSPRRPSASANADTARLERANLRASFFTRMAANSQLESGRIVRRCANGYAQQLLTSLQGHYPFSLEQPTSRELLTGLLEDFNHRYPEPDEELLVHFLCDAVTACDAKFSDNDRTDKNDRLLFRDELVKWLLYDHLDNGVAAAALMLCESMGYPIATSEQLAIAAQAAPALG